MTRKLGGRKFTPQHRWVVIGQIFDDRLENEVFASREYTTSTAEKAEAMFIKDYGSKQEEVEVLTIYGPYKKAIPYNDKEAGR